MDFPTSSSEVSTWLNSHFTVYGFMPATVAFPSEWWQTADPEIIAAIYEYLEDQYLQMPVGDDTVLFFACVPDVRYGGVPFSDRVCICSVTCLPWFHTLTCNFVPQGFAGEGAVGRGERQFLASRNVE